MKANIWGHFPLEILIFYLFLYGFKTRPNFVPGKLAVLILIKSLKQVSYIFDILSKFHCLHAISYKLAKYLKFIKLKNSILVFIGCIEHLFAYLPVIARRNIWSDLPSELFCQDLGINWCHALPNFFPTK
jgi:hypothetical protein